MSGLIDTKFLANNGQGQNNLNYGESCTFSNSSITFKEINSKIKIGKNVILRKCSIEIGRSSLLTIDDNSQFTGKMIIGSYCNVHIGKKLTVTDSCKIRVAEGARIIIGDDCMIASNVTIRANDGHPIYDIMSRDRLNPSQDIIIGSHVWLADDVMVLKGATIGDASVVGARSLVIHQLPSNAICVGSPAKVVRSGTTWERSPGVVTEEYYNFSA